MKTAHPFAISETAVSIRTLEIHSRGWLLDCEISQLSTATIENCRIVLDKLIWFLRDREYAECGIREIKEFLAYVSGAHKDSGGRWGNPQLKEHARPSTVSTYYARLRTFFRYLVDEEIISASPVEAVKRLVARQDQVQQFTREQVQTELRDPYQSGEYDGPSQGKVGDADPGKLHGTGEVVLRLLRVH